MKSSSRKDKGKQGHGGHGGERVGAGRHPLPLEQKRVRVDVRLLPSEVEWLKTRGNGNLSKGIREAIQFCLSSGEVVR
jgi:hypothetical protein